MRTFRYGRSRKIIYWGYVFDSLLELKYALSIQHEFEFLRARISIYYDPRTNRPTNYIRHNILRYTPDFLIRHKETGKAFLVEIKPRAYSDYRHLQALKRIAENYINWKGYDWQYKIIYDNEIILNLDQLVQFNECCKLINKSQRKLWIEKLNQQFDRTKPDLLRYAYDPRQTMFVMFGKPAL